MNATGVSVPGTPGIIQGCNSNICWGSTVNPMDVTDTFLDTFAVNTYGLPTALLRADGTQEQVQWQFQTYYVNQMTSGSTDNIARDTSIGYTNGGVTIIVPRHNNGPVVQLSTDKNDCSLTGEATSPAVTCGLSIAYTGWGATFELKAFKQINLARNIDEFQTALSYFDFGSQNFAYADTAGNIAYFTSAENPIRDDLQNLGTYVNSPPFFIRDGSGAAHNDWLPVTHPQPNQAIPFEIMPASEMPHVINPAAGYFANANNDPIGVTLDNNPFNQARPGGGIYYLNYAYDAYRVGRIDRLLSSMIASGHKLTTDDIKSVQLNNQPVDAQLVLPYLLTAYDNASAGGAWAPLAQLAGDPAIAESISRLRAWDLSTPTGLQQGFDAGRAAGSPPTQSQLDNSVAATEFFMWRSNAIKNTIDATLTQIGLADYLPGDDSAYTSLKFLLDAFPQLGGKGASGIPFFNAPGAPDPASARDYILLEEFERRTRSTLQRFVRGGYRQLDGSVDVSLGRAASLRARTSARRAVQYSRPESVRFHRSFAEPAGPRARQFLRNRESRRRHVARERRQRLHVQRRHRAGPSFRRTNEHADHRVRSNPRRRKCRARRSELRKPAVVVAHRQLPPARRRSVAGDVRRGHRRELHARRLIIHSSPSPAGGRGLG